MRRIAEKLRSAVADATGSVKATHKQATMSGKVAVYCRPQQQTTVDLTTMTLHKTNSLSRHTEQEDDLC